MENSSFEAEKRRNEKKQTFVFSHALFYLYNAVLTFNRWEE